MEHKKDCPKLKTCPCPYNSTHKCPEDHICNCDLEANKDSNA